MTEATRGGAAETRPVRRPPRIAVCGGGVAGPEEERTAEAVGRGIAEAGGILICGGHGGVMQAAARGAAGAGGLTIGVLPGDRASAANPYIAVPLPTGMGEGRNVLVVRFADAVIAVGGEWGTLSEIALAMKIGVPVVLLEPTIASRLGLPVARDAPDAVDRAVELASSRRPSEP